MGWGNCGKDSKGRPIGYNHKATCDFEGCNEKIDRGLAFACGGMHGENENYCEGYFCAKHLSFIKNRGGKTIQLCPSCQKEMEEIKVEDD